MAIENNTDRGPAKSRIAARAHTRRRNQHRLKKRLARDFALLISVPVVLIAYGNLLLSPGKTPDLFATSQILKVLIVVGSYVALLVAFRHAATQTQTALDTLEETRSTLDAAIELERLLAGISARFANVDAVPLEDEVQACLTKVGRSLPTCHLARFRVSAGSQRLDQFSSWSNGKMNPLPEAPPGLKLEWMHAGLNDHKSIVFSSLADLPEQAVNERNLFEALGVHSAMLAPFAPGSTGRGFLGLLSREEHREWNESEVELFAGLLSDALERNDTEEALRHSEARFQGIIQVASDAIISVDHKQNILIFNHGAEEMYGYAAADIIGQPFERLLPVTSINAHRSYVAQFLRSPANARRLGGSGELLARRKNGECFPVEATVSKLETAGRAPVLTFIQRDMSQRRKAEFERAKLESQLRQSQKMEAMGGLAGGIAHDFNNLLGAMIGNTELAMKRAGDDDKLRMNHQRIMEAGYRASRLVQQILTFSRVTSADLHPVDVTAVVKEAIALVESSLPAMITIRTRIAPEVGHILSGETQIHQMIMNLCTNAHHAIGERAGEIRITLRRIDIDEIFVTGRAGMTPGPYVLLSVSDTGCGMNEATKKHIFEPFFTTKPVGKGTGMGLAVIHGIVLTHGGQIVVESEQGHGTKIEIYLPVFVPDNVADEGSAPGSELPPQTGSERVLLVDDETALIQTTQEILEELGYRVTAISDSLEALRRFRENPHQFDIVITDQAMPNMTGMEMAEQMMELRPELPIIIATGYSETVTPETAKQMGLRGYVSKPYMAQDLAGALRTALENPV